MKTLIAVVAISVVVLILGQFLPWYCAGFAAIVGGYLLKFGFFKTLLVGFLGVGLAWLCYSFYLDSGNSSILSNRIAQLLKMGSGLTLMIVSAIIGGILGALGAILGREIRILTV